MSEIEELRDRLNAALEASSIAEAGRLRYKDALKRIVAESNATGHMAWGLSRDIANEALNPTQAVV